ncbi:protein PAT1 homolog 2 isoform X1 [Corythoichthys intestinalis]|uniref:protein PAT1 homolog 2 isoform X1 n=1 Tax=Corythoichthys intestinalis TaxID=161448 RepID=UPI0025A60038|nr:protein PAT1 homolog 2 isoform X1 [Corythoichthys intestinalis]
MSDSEHMKVVESEACQQPEWPENGGEWSEEEGESSMDCGLLQAMAEDDEDINVHNEETFGMDVNEQETADSPNSLLQFQDLPPRPQTPPPELQPSSPPGSPSPPRRIPQYMRRGQRRVPGRGQIFEDPAVMRIVEGRPSLKSQDSAIVDCGKIMFHPTFDDWVAPSYRKTRRLSGSILQDSAIVCVIEGHADRGQHLTADFLEPASCFRGRRGAEPRGPYSRQHFGPRGPSPAENSFWMPGPAFSRQPLTPRQHFNQIGGFGYPSIRPCPAAPKMMHLQFGPNSPRPSHFYSPSSNPVQHFRYPGPVTQLHPQHKRLLNQKPRTFQRKTDGQDPYCNLMTAKEKEWIIRLQMIQLQSDNPFLDDYYYQEYYRRLEAKLAEEELGIRSKRETPKLTTPYITKTDAYTPVVHIEGSLGQVAVSTCYSPRHAISAVHAVQAQGPPEPLEQKDTRRQRLELLSEIEKLYIVLLDVEEMNRTKTSGLSESEERRLMETRQRKVEHIYSKMQHYDVLDSEEDFLPFLVVSKGKKLLARIMPFVKRDPALNILRIITSNLPTLMSRDADEDLSVLYPPLRNVIEGLTFSQLIGILRVLTSSDILSTNECLALVCQNKFGLSLLYALLSHGEKLLSSGVPLEPGIGDFETWTDTIFQVAFQLSQCSLVEPLLLPSNLLPLFCRYLDKRTLHQLKSNMESATGGLALPS